jgi:pyochelin biosynthetic protein PchC
LTSECGDKDLWIRHFHPTADPTMRLVCFPHAGGSATYYYPLSRSLAPETEVLSVQYPGRQDRRREKCIGRIPDLADHIFDALLPWSTRPFAFFGHSMGAALAFEVALRFARGAATGPSWLFASGRRAPALQRTEDIHLRDDAGLVAHLRSVGATDGRFFDDPEMLAAILPVARNDYKAIETYRCEPDSLLDCPVTVMVGDSDAETTINEAAAWREHCAREFEVRVLPGGHFYLDACLPDVVGVISAALTKCRSQVLQKTDPTAEQVTATQRRPR